MFGKIDLESIWGGNCFGAGTEIGVFALDNDPEVSLAPEHFW